MREELEKKLYSDFPELFVQRHKSLLDSPMSQGIDVGDGWYQIIYESCLLIQKQLKGKSQSGYKLVHVDDLTEDVTDKDFIDNKLYYIPEFAQIKQKWGTLTIYMDNMDEYTSGVINLCCHMSNHICEWCGSTDLADTDRYLTICKECNKNRKASRY